MLRNLCDDLSEPMKLRISQNKNKENEIQQ